MRLWLAAFTLALSFVAHGANPVLLADINRSFDSQATTAPVPAANGWVFRFSVAPWVTVAASYAYILDGGSGWEIIH